MMSRFDRTREKTIRAQALRGDMPNAERKLWSRLKGKQLGGFRFRRQHPVGPYFLDFYCPDIKLCIELDGDQHAQESAIKHDEARTHFLEQKEICVLRFWNNQIYEGIDNVLEEILEQALNFEREQSIMRDKIPSPWKGEG